MTFSDQLKTAAVWRNKWNVTSIVRYFTSENFAAKDEDFELETLVNAQILVESKRGA